jgi:hypothetical protein
VDYAMKFKRTADQKRERDIYSKYPVGQREMYRVLVIYLLEDVYCLISC